MRRKRKVKPFTAEMTMIDAASDGRAVARHEGEVVFVEGGVPGDRAEVFVFGKQKKVLAGRIQAMIEPSKDRVTPACQHFAFCAGCKWQQMSYEAQIGFKEKQVLDILRRVGKVEIGEALPILGAPQPYWYRNKLEFSFSAKPWLKPEDMNNPDIDPRSLGFHAPRFFDKVININECLLQHELVNRVRNELGAYARAQDIPFYNIREHTGYLRTLTFRSSRHSNEFMLILVVAKNDPDRIDQIFTHLATTFPEITSFVWVHSPKLNSSYTDLPYQVWQGPGYLTERLGRYEFRIRPVSFFQTNPEQAERLYGVVRDFLMETLPAGQARHPIMYDLYSGTGSIGIFLEKYADKIVGIEYVESAVQDAWENVRLNELDETRFSFYAGDMKDLLREPLLEEEGHPDIVIADPPRQGMDGKVVWRLLEILPAHIIYVSCKPATQARDLELLREWYEVVKVQPVDMFPQTAHVENVALLRKRSERLVITPPQAAEAGAATGEPDDADSDDMDADDPND
jgi:23S rRNA (uracil1939-C5)-methyltransferase